MSNELVHSARLDRPNLIKVLWCLGTAIFAAVFLWGAWQHGPFALGLNAMVYFGAVLGLLLYDLHRHGVSLKRNQFWIVPVGMIILGFGLYDNPFFKVVSFLALPFLLAAGVSVSRLTDESTASWDSHFLSRLVLRFFGLLRTLGESMQMHGRLTVASQQGNGTLRRVVVGILVFVVVALTVLVPLLSSADPVFASRMGWMLTWFQKLVTASTFVRTAFALLLSVSTLAAVLAWTKPMSHTHKPEAAVDVDSIVVGIFLGGTLALYLLFLSIQLEHLWIGKLPFDFKETEHLVKSGFWQLLGLTLLNIVLYFYSYRKTKPAVQKLLGAFMFASLLLLVSAAHRVALYVTYYGFSYEKFYAAYAVLFCAILLVWLIGRLFAKHRADIMRFATVLCLWMFGIVAVFPVEQFVMRANIVLVHLPNTQIRLYEMTMLSPDVLGLVKQSLADGRLTERAGTLGREGYDVSRDEQAVVGWYAWIESTEQLVDRKKGYEMSVANAVEVLSR